MADLIEILSPKALSDLKTANELIVELIKNIGKAESITIGAKTPSGSDSAIKKLNDQYLAQQKIIDDLNIKLNKYAESQARTISASKNANRQTTEEIVNQNILNRNARQMAVIQSTLAGAYQKLSAEQAKAATTVQNLIARGRTAEQTQRQYNAELRKAQKEFDTLNKRVLAADHAVGRFQRNVGNYPKLVGGIKDLVSALGVTLGAAGIAMLAKNIFDVTRELQSMDLALKQITGSQEEAASAQSFLSEIAEKYGVDIQTLTKSYIGFYAGAKNAIESGKISAEQIKDIFESVAKASGAIGLSQEQQEGAFLAIQQMISKGNIQAEELRGQLSERLPGAFGILAKSMGVTEVELNKLLKDGKVLAAEVLPAFAKELEKAYGIENLQRVETLNASVSRLGNSWTDFVRALNDGDGAFSATLVGLINKLAEAVEGASILLENAERTRARTLKSIRQKSYEDQTKDYRDLENLDERFTAAKKKFNENQTVENRKAFEQAKRLRDIEIIQKNNQFVAEIDRLKEEIRVNTELNEQKRKNSLTGKDFTFAGVTVDEETRNRQTAIKAANNLISSYYGRIAAGNKIIEENTKQTEKNTDVVDYSNIVLAAKIRYLKELTDASRAVYEAEKKRREIEIENIQQLAENEQSDFSDRIEHYGDFLQKKQELLIYSNQFEALQSKKQREKDLDEAQKAETAALKQIRGKSDAKSLTAEQQKAIGEVVEFYRKERTQIGIKYDAIDLKNQREFSDAYLDIAEETAKAEVAIRKAERETLQNADDYRLQAQIALLKKTEENEKNHIDVRQAAFQSELALERRRLDLAKMREQSENPNKIEEITEKYKALYIALDNLESPYEKIAIASREAFKSLAESFSASSLSEAGLGSFSQFFNGEFEKVLSGFDKFTEEMGGKLEGQRQAAIYTTLAISEAFQEMYNFLAQASKHNFDVERQQLDRKYEVSKLFAQGNADAIAELDREREERQREIANREAKANKQLTIFNIALNAAQGIIAAYKDGNIIKGSIFAALIAGIAAVQIAAVNSQDVPSYFKGTENHPGGLMMINDAKGSKYKEIFQTPDGKKHSVDGRNRVVNAQKGTKVFTAERSELMFDNALNNILNERSISMLSGGNVFNNQTNVDVSGLREDINSLHRTMANKPAAVIGLNGDKFSEVLRIENAQSFNHNARLKTQPTKISR